MNQIKIGMCTWGPQIQNKDITHEKKKKKTEIARQKSLYMMFPLLNERTNVYVEEVVHNKPADSPIVPDQVSNKNIHNSSNNAVFLVTVSPKV